jgi:hypothetical protein
MKGKKNNKERKEIRKKEDMTKTQSWRCRIG